MGYFLVGQCGAPPDDDRRRKPRMRRRPRAVCLKSLGERKLDDRGKVEDVGLLVDIKTTFAVKAAEADFDCRFFYRPQRQSSLPVRLHIQRRPLYSSLRSSPGREGNGARRGVQSLCAAACVHDAVGFRRLGPTLTRSSRMCGRGLCSSRRR